MEMSLPELRISVDTASPTQPTEALLVVGAFKDGRQLVLTPSADRLNRALNHAITQHYDRGIFSAELGNVHFLSETSDYPQGTAVIGLGERKDFNGEALKTLLEKAAPTLGTWSSELALTVSEWIPDTMNVQCAARLFAATLLNALHPRQTLKSSESKPLKTRRIRWFADEISDEVLRGLKEGRQCADAMVMMRYLADLPGNICTPDFLAQTVMNSAQNLAPLTVEVWSEKEIAEHGMGAFLSVAQGSVVPPRFIIMRWQGTSPDVAPLALVGKGITFDAGGISLKPATNMADMTYDMSGAAAVIGTLFAAARAQLPKNLLGVVAACENMPSGSAAKPGDVVTSFSGKTIEILNTDCEGRMILADALAWTAQAKPEIIIDIATLTGACCVALGAPYSGLFTTDRELSEELTTIGRQTLDEVWPLPVGKAYRQLMISHVADIANQATTRDGGASSAAAFLSVFADNCRWAHLDIAATANTGGRDRHSTGRPASLLTQFLIEHQSEDQPINS